MLIAVAERLHVPDWDQRRVNSWWARWREKPLHYMRRTPCMLHGPTRRRFDEMTEGADVSQIINLLPPDNECGTWDTPWAFKNAELLYEWSLDSDCEGFLLLGRRVTNAFTSGLEFCESIDRFLSLPHPSGRSQYLNNPDNLCRVRKAVRRFAKNRAPAKIKTIRRTSPFDTYLRWTGKPYKQTRKE